MFRNTTYAKLVRFSSSAIFAAQEAKGLACKSLGRSPRNQ